MAKPSGKFNPNKAHVQGLPAYNRPPKTGAGAGAGRGAAGPGSAGPRAPRRPGVTIDQWAKQQAQRFIDSQVAAIEQQRQVFLDELDKRSKLEAERGLALAQALQGMNFGGRIQDIYGTAAGDIAGLAGGFSEGMRAQANAQAAEQANMLSGTGQEGAVRNEGVGMGDVLYGSEGYIPGRSLSETGAAFGMQAALEPSFAARIGQLEAGRVHSEGLEGLDQFTEALIEARSQSPELMEKFRSMRLDAKNEAWKQRFEMLKWQADQHYRNYMLALERGDRKLATKEYQLAVRKQRQAEIEAQRKYNLDVRDQTWRESPQNPDNRPGRSRGGRSQGGLTPTQKRDSLKEVVEASDNIAKDVAAAIQAGEWYVGSGPPAPKARKKLFMKLYRNYKHLTMGNHAAQARLRQIINQTLDAALKAGPKTAGGSGWERYLTD